MRYQIEIREDLRDGPTDLDGWIQWGQLRILIDKDLADDKKQVILWHEILHGILEQAGHAQNEDALDALAYGIVQVVDDNPEIIRAFREEAKCQGS
jgi:hypothetical protein